MATPPTREAVLHSRYRLEALLGETLYGGVFLARDLCAPHGRDGECAMVALKLVELQNTVALAQAAAAGLQKLDDPQVELEAAEFLRGRAPHPNIVRYVDEFVENGALYFVLEYCADGDLYHYASKQPDKRLPCVDALSVVSQIAGAVAFLHAHNLAHRDLSLENTLLSGGTCKVSDFGLSTAANTTCVDRVGKAYYMAPEVVAPGVAYDPKAADVWSLGILLFVLVTGSPLVEMASTDNVAFLSFRKFGLRRVLDTWGATPRMLDSAIDLLEGMLEVDPSKRLTIEQVLAHRAFADWQAIVEQYLVVSSPPVC
jgi:serine/threonine protein kinase